MLLLCHSLLRADTERGVTAPRVRPHARSADTERGVTAPRVRPHARSLGQYWRDLTNEWKLRFFFLKSLGLSVCTCYGEKQSSQKGLKVAKYSAKFPLDTREWMAEGGWYWGSSPLINKHMGNTGGCLWECRQHKLRNAVAGVYLVAIANNALYGSKW